MNAATTDNRGWRSAVSRRAVALWVAYLAFDTGSQLAFKWAADAAGPGAIDLQWTLRVLTAPGLLVGITCYLATLVVWLRLLARTDLSRAFPMSGLAYITVPILAIVLFGESLTFLEATGIAAICAGVALLATEGGESAPESTSTSYPERSS